MAEPKPVELLALPADGSEIQFDGMPLAPGVHLRWSFWPELGWPSGGFDVKRRFWYRDEFTRLLPAAWESITAAALRLPATPAAAVARVGTVTSGVATAAHEADAASLMQVVGNVNARTRVPRGRQWVELPALDLLLAASLDPYVARALGLALVDGTVAPRTPADYQVLGHWGAIPFPWHETLFDRLTPADLAAAAFDGTRCRWFSDRIMSLVAVEGRPTALQLTGVGQLTLRIELAMPAREIEIDLETPAASAAVTALAVHGRSGTVWLRPGLSPGLTVTASGSALRITTPADRPVDELEIRSTTTALSTWRMTRFRYRRRTGLVGTQASRIVRVSPLAGAAVAEEHVSVVFPAPAVWTPPVAAVRHELMPSTLGDDGRLKPEAWRVEAVTAPPVARPGIDLARPVRLHTGYARAAGGGTPSRAEVVTMPLPMPGQVLAHVGFWRLDGTLASVGGGPPLVARGSVQYVERPVPTFSPIDMQRRTMYLTGRLDARDGAGAAPGCLEAATAGYLDTIGTELHVQLWTLPIEDPEPFPTLVGSDWRSSFWFGLSRSGAQYRLRFWLNGTMFESSGTIPQGSWSHVAVHYDGQRVRFFINGALTTVTPAALGPVRPNPARRVCIGCDPEPANAFAFPFAGHLADLQIRRAGESAFVRHRLLAAWALDGDLRERASGATSGAIGSPRFATDHPETAGRRSAQFDGAWCVSSATPRLADPGRRLCLKLRVKPDAGQSAPVIAASRGWKLGLRASGSGYVVSLTVGRRSVSSSQIVEAGRWSDVVVGADGARVVFYVNGRPAGAWDMRYGRIPDGRSGADASVTIGADVSSRAGALTAAYRGLVADIEAGDAVPAPAAPVLLSNPAPFVPSEHPPDVPPADIVLSDLDAGFYRVLAYGVDLFGRMGPLATSASFTLPVEATPPVPGGARARFLPLLGQVTAATAPADGSTGWRVQVTLARPASLDEDTARRLLRHDAELARVAPDPREPRRMRIEQAETWEIAGAVPGASALTLDLIAPPLPRLRPAAGQRVTIAHDLLARVEWTWTGTQRLLAPGVDRFRLVERRWQPASAAWATAWNEFGGAAGVPVAAGDVVAQDEMAGPLAVSAVSHEEWQRLVEGGVMTVPEPFDPEDVPDPAAPRRRPRSKIWRVVLPVTASLPAAPHRLNPASLTPDDFVAGALVAYNAAADVYAWQIFTVHWHQWTPGAGWTLYVVESSKGRDVASGAPPVLSQARYYPGQRYRFDAALAPPPAFGADRDGNPVGTLAIEIAVASIDAATGRQSPLDAAADRRTDGAANVVAVMRERPLVPLAPAVAIDRADYYGKSRATVRWAAEPGVTYHVYRATDNAIVARDIELRRRGLGLYERPEAERFADDPDFDAWLAARWPGWVRDWTARLFVARPEDLEADPDPAAAEAWRAAMSAWEAASAVWNDWAARFYAALPVEPAGPSDSHTLQAIAGRDGIEDAFALVNAKPVAGGALVDTVPGNVRNRYLYRLRSQSASVLRSTRYGRVSAPRAAPATRPPAAPALTRIEAGERRLTIRWTLNREPELAEYRLHRARTREVLEDLRWWRPDAGERIFRIADPRLRAAGRGITIPDGLDAAEALAIFRAEEYGGRALDYISRDAGGASEIVATDGGIVAIRRLRAIPDGAAVVLVYRTAAGDERAHGSLADGGSFVDEDLVAGDDWFYRLVAVDSAGNVSPGSAILKGRAFDTSVPAPPPLDAAADPAARAVRLSWTAAPGVQHLVQRYAPGNVTWTDRSGWLAPGLSRYEDTEVQAGNRYVYRLRVRSAAGVLGREHSEAIVVVPGER